MHSWQVLDESQKFYRLLQLLGEWHEHGADLCGLGKPASHQALACGANQNDATWRNMTQHDATWHNMTPCFNCLCPSCFNCFCPPREPLSFEQCHHDDPRWSTRCYHDICTPAEGLRPQWASTRLPELDLSTQTDISSNHTSLCNCKRCRPLWIPGIKTLT